MTISKGDKFYDPETEITYEVVLVENEIATVLNSETKKFMEFRTDVLLESSHGSRPFLQHTKAK